MGGIKFGFVLNDRVFLSIKDLPVVANLPLPSSGTSMTSTVSEEPDKKASVSPEPG